MFRCRRARVSATSLLVQGFNFTGSLQVKGNRPGDITWPLRNHHAMCCSLVYRRLTQRKTGVLYPRDERSYLTIGCKHGIPIRSDLVAQARVTLFALNSTSRRDYGDSGLWTSSKRTINELNELSFLSVRPASFVMVQTRYSSTAPKQKQETPADEEPATDIKTQEPLTSGDNAKAPESDEKPSKTQQLRKVFKEYGAVGVSFHIGISLISLGIFYLAVSSGIDMVAVLCKLGFSESLVQSKVAAGTSTFVLAYAIHKLFAPVRISITLMSVPLIVRYLRKTGLFKPRPSGP